MINSKRPTPRHIIIMPNVKDKDTLLKAVREKHLVTYKGDPIKLPAPKHYTRGMGEHLKARQMSNNTKLKTHKLLCIKNLFRKGQYITP